MCCSSRGQQQQAQAPPAPGTRTPRPWLPRRDEPWVVLRAPCKDAHSRNPWWDWHAGLKTRLGGSWHLRTLVQRRGHAQRCSGKLPARRGHHVCKRVQLLNLIELMQLGAAAKGLRATAFRRQPACCSRGVRVRAALFQQVIKVRQVLPGRACMPAPAEWAGLRLVVLCREQQSASCARLASSCTDLYTPLKLRYARRMATRSPTWPRSTG